FHTDGLPFPIGIWKLPSAYSGRAKGGVGEIIRGLALAIRPAGPGPADHHSAAAHPFGGRLRHSLPFAAPTAFIRRSFKIKGRTGRAARARWTAAQRPIPTESLRGSGLPISRSALHSWRFLQISYMGP